MLVSPALSDGEIGTRHAFNDGASENAIVDRKANPEAYAASVQSGFALGGARTRFDNAQQPA